MNIESIIKQTAEHYKSEGKEEFFNERLQNFKKDIIRDYEDWRVNFPGKSFDDFKQSCYNEMKGFSLEYGPNLSIGIYVSALDLIDPQIDLI